MERNTMRVPNVSTLAEATLGEPDVGPVLGLGDPRDRRVIADALRVLLRERSEALAFAMRIADECGRSRPDAADFALSDIIRLARIVERVERDGALKNDAAPAGAR
ncbi:hypothetical protein BLA18110_06474 [Burkholderia lata]|uniref:hypothetical protein n=1 Tax=Burkholderia lata (strain ATCC 17760 / DSM 23089 / LMG 22485 / NCIMB 9086 / R18194 / 383) TaxID=482957 RepID=UPI0014537D3C|nr:hypothetical protein [Burkholderia lata]VWD35618.1 hypothetical protein BLA18110_06474 [Burkholderia lata]